MFIIDTLLGFLLSQLRDLYYGIKYSDDTPDYLDAKFFFKTTWVKSSISLAISLTLAFIVHGSEGALETFVNSLVKDYLNFEIPVGTLTYFTIGAASEWLMQKIDKRTGAFSNRKRNEKPLN